MEEIIIFQTLSDIGKVLNNAGVTWAVGASILLGRYGLAGNPNDIDLLVHINEISKVDELLQNMGEKRVYIKTDQYSTEYFYEYIIDGTDIDVMAGLTVNHLNGSYHHVFDHSSVTEFITYNGVDITYSSLEDWFVIYQLISGREEKVRRIEMYLLENGVKHPFLLERALDGNLPQRNKDRINKLLKCIT